MRRRVMCALLGWFFIAGYGSVTKHDFHTKKACDDGRADAVTVLGPTNAKKLGPCREDIRPPIKADVTGTFRPETPPK